MLEHILDDELAQDFVPTLQSLKKLNEYVASRKLKPDFKEVIDNFSLNYMALHVNHGLSLTPKIHIIMEHIADYCHEFGVSLGHCSDQTIEAVHQVVNQRFLNLKYYIKFTDSDKQGEKLFNGIMHVNSYNI